MLFLAAIALPAAGLAACGSDDGQDPQNNESASIPADVQFSDLTVDGGEPGASDGDSLVAVVRPDSGVPSWLVGVQQGDAPGTVSIDTGSGIEPGCRSGLETAQVRSATGGAAFGRFYHATDQAHDLDGLLLEFDIISSGIGPEGVSIGISPTESKTFSITPKRLTDDDDHFQTVFIPASDIGPSFAEVTSDDHQFVACVAESS